jgi:hypothetical protein
VNLIANGFGREVGLDLARAPDCSHFAPGVWARFGTFQRVEALAHQTRQQAAVSRS